MDLLLHLRGFVAIADHLNVSRAADALGIDQPLLSRRLRNLEDHLGVRLVDRSRRQIALTTSGSQLAPRARALLEHADHVLATVAAPVADSFRLGLPAGSDPAVVARLVTALDSEDLGVTTVPETLPEGESASEPSQRGPGWWVVPGSPANADWITPLGVGRLPDDGHLPGSRQAGLMRLGDLRPRRGRPGPPVLVLEEDDLAGWAVGFREVADRSGVGPRTLRTVPALVARAEVLAGRAVMLCSARQAERDGLCWVPLADEPLRRCYRLIEVPPVPGALRRGPLRQRILQLVAAAVDAEAADRRTGPRWGQP